MRVRSTIIGGLYGTMILASAALSDEAADAYKHEIKKKMKRLWIAVVWAINKEMLLVPIS